MASAQPLNNLKENTLRFLGNVTVGVALLALWGVLTLIGVVIEQGKDPASYFSWYPAPIARAILRLDFNDIYHSVWYLLSIGLVLASMTTATFTKVIPRRLPPHQAVKIDAIPLHDRVTIVGSVEEVRAGIEEFFTARGWSVMKREIDGTLWSFADRFNWARVGVLVNHTAILIIAAGTIMYWAWGFSGETAILTGQAAQIPQTHDLIRLDRFSYTIEPIMTKSGIVYQPIDYVSHVTVVGRNGTPASMIVRVNHPIDLDGTLIYQASYGFAMRFLVFHGKALVRELSGRPLLEGDAIAIPGTGRSVVYVSFVPTIDPRTHLPSPDPRISDPGAVLGVIESGVPLGEMLLPLRSPLDLGDGWRVVPAHEVVYSGFQYRYDPGVPLVAAGAGLLLIGLIISFYFLPARLHVRVDDAGEGRCTVGVAATTVKGYDIFEEAFHDLIAQLKHVDQR